MLRSLNRIAFVVLLLGGLRTAGAFSLLGPIANGGDAWQVQALGYNLPGDIGAPKNIGEEYRRNTPLMYYAYDQNFSGFFGLNGEAAVDGAFANMNGLTNVSSYSTALSEFPMNSQSINYTAQALGLTDVKSLTLSLLVEQLGLAEPDRFTWTLHNRYLPPGGTCPISEEYLVVQRNFDPVPTALTQIQYSSYVNGTLYSYLITEACQNTPYLAEAVEFPVDPFAQTFTAVASLGLDRGGFYGGLTRDDVGGLRYLLRTNNINYETAAAGSLLQTVTTNLTATQLFPVAFTNSGVLVNGTNYGTADLGALLRASLTNAPATLQLLFPGVIVATSSNYFILATNAVVSSYFTNYYGEPSSTPPHLIVTTNYSLYPLTIYVDTFANIVNNHYYPNTTTVILTTTVQPAIGYPAGTLVTNVTSQTVILTNVPSGDYYVLNGNQCPVDILYPLQTNVVITTNLITGATNTVAATNAVTATNATGYFYSQSVLTYATNYIYVTHPVNCAQIAAATGSYEGVENIKFVRVPDGDIDPLTGNFIVPITNNYTMVVVTNSQPVLQNFQRVLTQPDILLTAIDQASGPSAPPPGVIAARSINFNQNNILPGLAGPGTINPPTVFTYNKVGQYFANGSLAANGLNATAFLSEFTQLPLLAWASFDGSTNDPVVYPNGTSIQNLENQIFVQIIPVSLPNGTNGLAYAATTFTATGGAFTPPFTWSQTGLPTGLTLSAGGTLSGTPTQSGTFDFTLQLTDIYSRTVQWIYTIIIQ